MTLFVGAIAIAFAFASCKKEYTCECSTTINGVTTKASGTVKDTKKKAEDACNKGDSNTSGIVIDCKIK